MKLILLVLLSFLLLPFLLAGVICLAPVAVVCSFIKIDTLERLMGEKYRYMPQKPANAW